MKNNKLFNHIISDHKFLTIYLPLFFLGIIYYAPRFLMTGIPHYINEDTYFHLNRLVGMSNVFSSPVNFKNFAHNGPIVNIFYPWLSMYPMYILFLITGSYTASYKLFYLFLTVITLFSAYYVMLQISENHASSFTFSVLYTYSMYRFINLFLRAHLGESISMTALLFVLLGMYRISFDDHHKWHSLTLGMMLIAYSHNLFLAITSFMICLYLLFSFWFWDHKKERVISFIKAASVSILLCLGSFIPIFQYISSNHLYTPGGSGLSLQSTAFSIQDILEKSVNNIPVSYASGFIVLASLAGTFIFIFYRFFSKKDIKKNTAVDFFFLLGTLVFFGSSSLLPWKQIGDHTPLAIFQYVYRLNAHSAILILAAFSYYFPCFLHTHKSEIISLVLISSISVILHFSAILTLHKDENTRILESEISAGDAISFDYAPLQAKLFRNASGYTFDDLLIDGSPHSADISFSRDGSKYTLFIDPFSSGLESVSADIPVFWYSSQLCSLNGERISTSMSERGGTLVDIDPKLRNEISVFYHHSFLTYISWTVSFVSLIFFIHSYRKRSC